MCGIAGFFGGVPSAGFSEHALRSLATRGPDGRGVWQSDGGTTCLIHTRLAILDLTEASAQPMAWSKGQGTGGRGQGSGGRGQGAEVGGREEGDEQGDFALGPLPFASSVLVFNGEIYNYRELRAELEAAGETFASDGDTEVLLRLLMLEGEACLLKLAGMFAFAFWDEATGKALLARDPLGIKPLYLRNEQGILSFASECRVLRREGDAADPTACYKYFLWGSVPDPRTLIEPIQQLPAGHLLRWTAGKAVIERWGPDILGPRVRNGPRIRPADAARTARTALEESVGRHLVSDVPVGIFLSGGIDSTVLLALTRAALGTDADIRTFSIGFEDPAFDESDLARRTADHFGANHTEWKMTAAEGADEIPAFLAAMDQPGIDGFNTWCVSKLARREGMKVVMSGLGGDEIFAGYTSFDRVPQYRAWHRALGPLRSVAAEILGWSPPASRWQRLAAFLRAEGDWLGAYHVQRGIFTSDEALALARDLTGIQAASDWNVERLPEHPRDAVSFLEITRYMRYQLLRDSDVYSMAHGLELRVPFVDSRLLNTLADLPADLRLRRGKQLLVEAVPEIPEWVLQQPKKGFRFPFETWMESRFGSVLAEAERQSPVPLKAWYRTWAVAAAMRVLGTPESRSSLS